MIVLPIYVWLILGAICCAIWIVAKIAEFANKPAQRAKEHAKTEAFFSSDEPGSDA